MKLLPIVLGSAFAQTQSEILDLKKRTFLQEIELDAILQLQDYIQFEDFNVTQGIIEGLNSYRDDHPDKDNEWGDKAANLFDFERSTGRLVRTGGGGLTLADRGHVIKYLQMKIVILFMQKNKFLGKYCFYGCWCFPRGAGNNGGFGQPVDNIDKSCREYSTCYNCIYNQNIGSQKCPENTADRYQIGGFVDRFGQVQIFCTDPWGTCNRSRCECDRDLALKLRQHEPEWNMQYHHKWGKFQPEETCNFNINEFRTSGKLKMVGNDYVMDNRPYIVKFDMGTHGGGGGGNGGPQSSVKNSMFPIYGPIIGCCGRFPTVHYFRKGQKCCADGQVTDAKAPCDSDFTQ